MKNNILILSPHLDDAFFSMSSFIHNFVGEITLVTFFTKEEKNIKSKFKDDYLCYADVKTRKKEDKMASELASKINTNMKIKSIYLNLPDNIFRKQCDYFHIINKAIFELTKIKNITNFQQIYCPLGVGEHTDHIITYISCNKVFNSDQITYYYEFPYSNIKLNLIHRLNTLNYKYNGNYNIKIKDIKDYYNHPIYNSTPKIIRILRIIYIFLYFCLVYFKKKINVFQIKNSINIVNKYKNIMCYSSQIKPIFKNKIFVKNELEMFNNEIYIKV